MSKAYKVHIFVFLSLPYNEKPKKYKFHTFIQVI